MKTQQDKTLWTLSIVMTGLITVLLSFNAGANDKSNQGNQAQVIYQSHSINHSIFSYLSSAAEEIALDPKLIYVDQANGPAIHSYTHSGSEKTVDWNVEYVDTAYNPAIYSYEGPLVNGKVKVLPIVAVD